LQGALVAGFDTKTAAIAFIFVYLDNFSDHLYSSFPVFVVFAGILYYNKHGKTVTTVTNDGGEQKNV